MAADDITASGLFLLRFSFQTLLHQIMIAALPQQGKQQGAEAASECQRDDGSGCAVQLGPHKQAGKGQQQQGQGGDIAKQLPAEAGAHAAVQPVEAGGKVGQLQVGTYQQGTLDIAGGHALAEGDTAQLPAGRQGEGAGWCGQGLGRGDLGSPLTIPSYERGVARLLRYDRHP